MFDLETTSTEDILTELTKRYEHVIFAGIKMRPTPDNPTGFIRSWRFKGSSEMCQGLAYGIMSHAQVGSDEAEELISSDEV